MAQPVSAVRLARRMGWKRQGLAIPVFVGGAVVALTTWVLGLYWRPPLPLPVVVGLMLTVVAAVGVAIAGGNEHALFQRTAATVGLRLADRFGLALALGALLVGAIPPLARASAAAAALTFVVALARGERLRPVRTHRELHLPAGVNRALLDPVDPIGEGDEQKVCRLPWRVPRPGRTELGGVVEVVVSLGRYEEMRAANPWRDEGSTDWRRFVVGGISDEVVQLAAALLDVSCTEELSTYLEISTVLAVAQGIPFARDIDSTGFGEYWRYPIETIVDGVGDGDCKTILAASVLLVMGHDVVLLRRSEGPQGHVALGVAGAGGLRGHYVMIDGEPYFWGETTEEGWRLGELPSAVDVNGVRIVRLS